MVSLYDLIQLHDTTRFPETVWPPELPVDEPWAKKPRDEWGKAEWREFAMFLLFAGDKQRRLHVQALEERDLYRLRAKRHKPKRPDLDRKIDRLMCDLMGIRMNGSGGAPLKWNFVRRRELLQEVERLKELHPAWSLSRACTEVAKTGKFGKLAGKTLQNQLKKVS